MALGATFARPTSLVAAALCALAIALIGSAPAEAAGPSACKRWGNDEPSELTNGHARKAVLCFVNRERSDRGIRRLKRDKRLQKASQRHNDRMDSQGCFSHVCPGEPGLDSRLRSVGYLTGGLSRWGYGENIAWGTDHLATPRAMVRAWMNSSGHRANILNSSFRDFGVGFTRGTPSNKRHKNGAFYTTDFGLRLG
jgi:uncharacterized protein YkwD